MKPTNVTFLQFGVLLMLFTEALFAFSLFYLVVCVILKVFESITKADTA